MALTGLPLRQALSNQRRRWEPSRIEIGCSLVKVAVHGEALGAAKY